MGGHGGDVRSEAWGTSIDFKFGYLQLRVLRLGLLQDIGHGIAGLLGVIGFPIAALLLSSALGHNEPWRRARKPLLWIANLSWVSVILLIATLATMTMQMARINGGHLPQHAPRSLPQGVLALDGWADRMIVLCNCAWVIVTAWYAIRVRRMQSDTGRTYSEAQLRASSHR